jgi:hypothetical protein
MATDNSDSNVISRPGSRPEGAGSAAGGVTGAVEKFRNLPRPAQIAIAVGVCLVIYFMVGGRHQQQVRPQNGTVNMGVVNGAAVSPTFTGIETDRPALMQSVFEQNRRDMADLRAEVSSYFNEQKAQKAEADAKSEEQQRQMQQMMSDFTNEIKGIQDERQRDSERLGQLAQQQQQMEMNAPVDGSTAASPVANRRRQITQITLGGGGGIQGALAPLAQLKGNQPRLNGNSQLQRDSNDVGPEARLPFIPPLGFVHGTLLNGVDAPTGGTPIPALVRLSGVYKTAMNSTVSLDGCFALVGFNGNVSTERAIGNPSRMTCIYPDGGAATYNIGGYVVDAEDGIIGVPGVFYEGDATRIAAAALADFAAGIGEIIEQNQSTNTVDSNGTTKTSLTGDQSKAQLAGGLSKSMSTLRDYLKDRVDRVQSFIRLDATRDINMVILTGTELRHEGNPWTQLFDAQAVEQAGGAGITSQQQQQIQPAQ